MKVLINKCYGGYGLSYDFIYHLKNFDKYKDYLHEHEFKRDDQFVVEEAIKFGLDKAGGFLSELEVIDLPDNVKYSIDEYDGMESIDNTWIEVSLEELKNGLSKDKLNLAKKVTCIKIK